ALGTAALYVGVPRPAVASLTGERADRPPREPAFPPRRSPDPDPGKGPRLKAGIVLAIEPMINAGGPEVRVLNDGWTAITIDGSYSAHFEHTVAITKDGPQVLTR